MASSIQFSCVLDPKERFVKQTVLWISSLLESGTAQPNEIVVHIVGESPAHFQKFIHQLGVKYFTIEPFGEGHAVYCNKLQQLNSSALNADVIVLCDTDIVFTENLRDHFLETKTVRSKIVDLPNPPLGLINELHSRLSHNFDLIHASSSLGVVKNDTIQANCNGGLYVFQKSIFEKIKQDWNHFAKAILNQEDLLGPYTKHADQLGFAFAILNNGITLEELTIEYNYPLNLYTAEIAHIKPKIIHYHHLINHDGEIEFFGNDDIERILRDINCSSQKYREDAGLYPNKTEIQVTDSNLHPLIVLGMHRSGTSLTTNWLHLLGLSAGDDLLGAAESNKKGHFEDIDFLNYHQSILRKNGLDPRGLLLPKSIKIKLSKTDQNSLLKILKSKKNDLYCFKDPRTCLFLDYYRQILPNANYLIVFRSKKDVVRSLLRREKSKLDDKRKKDYPGNKVYFTLKSIYDYFRLLELKFKFTSDWEIYNKKILDHIDATDKSRIIIGDISLLLERDKQIYKKLLSMGYDLKFANFSEVYENNLFNSERSFNHSGKTSETEKRIIDLLKKQSSDR